MLLPRFFRSFFSVSVFGRATLTVIVDAALYFCMLFSGSPHTHTQTHEHVVYFSLFLYNKLLFQISLEIVFYGSIMDVGTNC